jgi:hypothetical protein
MQSQQFFSKRKRDMNEPILPPLQYFASEEYKKKCKEHFECLKDSGAYNDKARQLSLYASMICCDSIIPKDSELFESKNLKIENKLQGNDIKNPLTIW